MTPGGHAHPARLPGGRPLPILRYHGHSRQGRPDVPLRVLRHQLGVLRDAGWELMGLTEALVLHVGAPERRIAALTFDHGFADLIPASEIVAEMGGRCTAYLATDFLAEDGGTPYLSWNQVAALHCLGVEVGSHGRAHRPFDTLGPRELYYELVSSRHRLEQVIGARVSSLSYPHGYVSRTVRAAVRAAGYSSACTLGRRVADRDLLLDLPRLRPAADTGDAALLRMLRDGEPGWRPAAERLAAPGWRMTRRLLPGAGTG